MFEILASTLNLLPHTHTLVTLFLKKLMSCALSTAQPNCCPCSSMDRDCSSYGASEETQHGPREKGREGGKSKTEREGEKGMDESMNVMSRSPPV